MKILELKKTIEKVLNNNKANNIITIDLRKKSYIADYMIIASGTSSKHIQSLSEIIVSELKRNGIDNCRIEGKEGVYLNYNHIRPFLTDTVLQKRWGKGFRTSDFDFNLVETVRAAEEYINQQGLLEN